MKLLWTLCLIYETFVFNLWNRWTKTCVQPVVKLVDQNLCLACETGGQKLVFSLWNRRTKLFLTSGISGQKFVFNLWNHGQELVFNLWNQRTKQQTGWREKENVGLGVSSRETFLQHLERYRLPELPCSALWWPRLQASTRGGLCLRPCKWYSSTSVQLQRNWN